MPDPVETDEEASLDKVQSKTSQPIVNCEKKASLEYKKCYKFSITAIS